MIPQFIFGIIWNSIFFPIGFYTSLPIPDTFFAEDDFDLP